MKRKLKGIVVMILILLPLLLGTILGIVLTRDKKVEEVIVEEEEIIEEPIIPDSFVGNIKNNVGVPSEIIDLIVAYNDAYFKSIYTLEQVSTSNYFLNEIDGAISDSSIKLLVESRKLYDFDFTLSKASYDLRFTDYFKDGDNYRVDFLMDEFMNFSFLGDICSQSYDIENTMRIVKVGEEYKIEDYDKTQGYYMMFYDNKYDSLSEVNDVYDYYYRQLKNAKENDDYLKSNASDTTYLADKSYEVAYDRQKAAAYANKYFHSRNDDWYDFSDEGGNCQNFASQCLIAGGMLMDYYGEDWYYDNASDRSVSWVQVPGFYEYCDLNEGSGLVCDTDANIYYADLGDIVEVGISSVTHATIVSNIVDGHILLNSNSIDMCNWPIEAYTYPTKKLIKILGSNY